MPTSRPTPPLTLVAAAGLQAVEALALLGTAGYLAVEMLSGRSAGIGFSLPLLVLAVVAGAVLARVSWGLLRLNTWARTPVVLCQLLALPVGFTLVQGGQVAAGAVLLVVAVAALAMVFAPPTTSALFGGEDSGAAR
ncbi:hypothetical protein [Allonocardiopsis opalescens]|uniref:Integral membrane protein n=1 Tax=Allonocardiopsis opalescens TaxID=1144618 RepID=A0A2T0QDP6_9ACTN|nr:hypothetical protein [Allonocardiopsis opalescens]PRY02057.1 hypothetical protein CLV72_101657 [Allonocardiopsis opalescens]